MSNTVKQKLPEWFCGELYKDGEEVTNPFSGCSYELNNVELSMYDFIIGATMLYETQGMNIDEAMVKDLRKGLDWFRMENAEAYMILLD